jgi:YVTN family beta-propeller protein
LFGISVNEKTNRIYVNSYNNVTATVIDGKTDKVIKAIPLNFEPTLLDLNSNTNRIYEPNYSTMLPNGTINYDGNIQVINGANDQIISTIPADGGVEALAVNKITNRIYATSFNDGTLLVVDGKTNKVVDDIAITPNYSTYGVVSSKRTNEIYVVSEYNSTLSVVDGKTDKVIDTVPFGTPTPSCAFDGSCFDLGTAPTIVKLDDQLGRIYIVGQGDGILYEFDTKTHHKIAEMDFRHPHK